MKVCIEAVSAGLCAALASVFAKLAMASEKVPDLCQSFLHSTFHFHGVRANLEKFAIAEDFCTSVNLAAVLMRLACFGLIFVFNAVMWTFFIKSLQRSSSIIATTTNTASNFFFTAVSGWMLFGESLSLLWSFGAVLIVAGLLLINSDSEESADIELKKKTL